MAIDLPIHVGDVTDRLRDLTDTVTDLPAHVGDVTGRLRDLSESATATARRVAPSQGVAPTRGWVLPLGLAILGAGLGAGVFMWLRSRRSSTKVASPELADIYVHA